MLADRSREVHRAGKKLVETINIGETWRDEGHGGARDTLDGLLDSMFLSITYSGREDKRQPDIEMSDCLLQAATTVFEKKQASGTMKISGQDDEEKISFLLYRID